MAERPHDWLGNGAGESPAGELSRQSDAFDSEHPSLLLALGLLSMRERLLQLLAPHLIDRSVGEREQPEPLDGPPDDLLLALLGALSFSGRAQALLAQAAPLPSPESRREASRTSPGDLLR